ncbi:hypothetical protein OG423_14070 [Micromonospora zamorensis]|uniref:hypothetical protein n=1 Tax=Micromonospora zamorensis TaxID=709883 RepID=UPI00352A857D|nr:hypothetical protein OG423_14070 [Micromonospora zamorensis]
MPGSTSTYGFPYLEPSDPPDIAGATQDLAEAVETELGQVAAAGPLRVRAGTANVVITSATFGSANVTFSPAFAGTPVVVATIANGSGSTVAAVVRVSSASSSSATLTVTLNGASTSVTVAVNWVAVG